VLGPVVRRQFSLCGELGITALVLALVGLLFIVDSLHVKVKALLTNKLFITVSLLALQFVQAVLGPVVLQPLLFFGELGATALVLALVGLLFICLCLCFPTRRHHHQFLFFSFLLDGARLVNHLLQHLLPHLHAG